MNRAIAPAIAGAVIGAVGAYAVIDRQQPPATPPDIVRDIGEVASISDAAADAHRDDRYAALTTVSDVLALPSRFARSEALHALAGRSDSAAVQGLVYEANRIADDTVRSASLDVLFARLAELDPESALAMARSPTFGDSIDIERRVWASWGLHDLDAAIAAAAGQPTAAERNLAAQSLFYAFGYMGSEKTGEIEAKLGIRPDATARARFLYQLADRSVTAAVDHVMTIPSSSERFDSARWLAHHLSRNQPSRAAGYASLFDNHELRQTYLDALARSLAAVDPRSVLDRMLGAVVTDSNRAELTGAMRALTATDIDAAIEYYGLYSTSGAGPPQLGFIIVEELAQRDPSRALEWARANETERFGHGLYEQVALRRIAMQDPVFAMAEVAKIRNAQQRGNAIDSIVEVIARSDPATAAGIVDSLDNPRERRSAASRLLNAWLGQDPDAAVSWLMADDKLETASMLDDVGQYLATTNTSAAIRLMDKVDAESAIVLRRQIVTALALQPSLVEAQAFVSRYEGNPEYSSLFAAMVDGLARKDLTAAAQMANTIPDLRERDAAMSMLVHRQARSDPVKAAALIESISSEQHRRAATSSLISTWQQQDPDGAAGWADNLPRGARRDDAIFSLANSWREMTPSRRLMIDSIGNPNKRIQAKAAQVRIVARTDWRKAERMLAELDLPEEQRQNLQIMIDHTRNR